MAAPTQELPSWLSFTTITLPQTTETSVVYLPLTYYGPSIPLDSDWTYGGLTSPGPSSSTSATSTAISTPSTTTTTSAIPTSSATPSAPSGSSLPSSTSSPSSSLPSASASASAIPTSASTSSGLSRGQLIAIIVGSVLGSLVLFLFLLCCWFRFCGGRRRPLGTTEESQTLQNTPETREQSRTPLTAIFRRRTRPRTRFTMVTPFTSSMQPNQQGDLGEEWTFVGDLPDSPPTSPLSPTSPTSGMEPGTGGTEADPRKRKWKRGEQQLDLLARDKLHLRQQRDERIGVRRPPRAVRAGAAFSFGWGANPFDLPPGAAPPGSGSSYTGGYNNNNNGGNGGVPMGRRILSPAQMAVLVEEELVLPRPSVESHLTGSHMTGDYGGDKEEGEVVVAQRVSLSPMKGNLAAGPSTLADPQPQDKGKEKEKEKRRSWIPRFSWLNPSASASARNSRDVEEEGEGEAGHLLFDAGAHSPTGSVSMSPGDALRLVGGTGGASTSGGDTSAAAAGVGVGVGMREFGARPLLPFLARLSSGTPPPRSSSRGAGSRPISGVSSGKSGMSSDGTNGSAKSGGTVYTDAREELTMSTRASFASRAGGGGGGNGEVPPPLPGAMDPLDAPAPPALAAFASSSQASLHRTTGSPVQSLRASVHSQGSLSHEYSHSRDQSLSAPSATLAGSTQASNTTLALLGTPATGPAPLPPLPTATGGKSDRERAYAHPPPGLSGFGYTAFENRAAPPTAFNPGKAHGKGSIGSWDAAGLELGFARPPSHEALGTFGSANANVVPVPQMAPGIRVVGAPHALVGVAPLPSPTFAPPPPPVMAPRPLSFGGGDGGRTSPYMRPGAASLPFVEGRRVYGSGGAPHLSLDLDDAPPGAEGRWRLLGGSAHSLLLGSSSSLGATGEWGEGAAGPGRRGTFGGGVSGAVSVVFLFSFVSFINSTLMIPTQAQYHHSPGQSSEHGSFHSRLASSLGSSSLSSGSSGAAHSGQGHAQLPSGASHSLYPSSGSNGSHSAPASARARTRALVHAGSVEGPLSPAVSAFGHRVRDADYSGSSGSHSAGGRRQENSSGSGSGSGEHGHGPERTRSPLSRARSPASPLLSPWAGGLDPDWRPT
ncbi:hypothetical protein B0H19DRAFT_1253270 [Mycena capillaripes]|nr:hypothetical protein B0H19DRAFT_1253270 [Mycena capillaripes]